MVYILSEWWNYWIVGELMWCVVFVVFVIDFIYVIMFGYFIVMVVYEMCLLLFCDDKLWKVISGVEVGRIELQFLVVGNKLVVFLEGFKWILSGYEVQMNLFGCIILMVGLFSVSWYMNQRDF